MVLTFAYFFLETNKQNEIVKEIEMGEYYTIIVSSSIEMYANEK